MMIPRTRPEPTWTRTPTGFRWASRGAELVRNGRSWTLRYKGRDTQLRRINLFADARHTMAVMDEPE